MDLWVIFAKSMLAKPKVIKGWDKTKQTVFDYANPLKNNVEKIYGIRGNVDDYVKQSKKIDKILKELSDKPDDAITKKLNQYFKQAPEDRGALKLSQKELSLLKKKDKRIKTRYLQSR